MSSPLPFPVNIDIGPTLGAAFLGAILASIMYGVTTLQALFYYMTYPKDSKKLIILVSGLWIMDSVDLAFVTHAIYTYFITDFLQPEKLEQSVWSVASVPITAGTVAFIVHQFLIYRIYALDKSLAPFAVFLSIFAFYPWSMAFVATGTLLASGGGWAAITNNRWITISADVTNGVLDLVIAATTCYLFRRGSNERTQRVLHKLSLYTISSGAVTSLLSTGCLIVYLASPHSFAYQVFSFVLAKAYANSVMASLNARQSLRGIGHMNATSMMVSKPQPHSAVLFAEPCDSTETPTNSEDLECTTNTALSDLELKEVTKIGSSDIVDLQGRMRV
ncbi:hypothetical protein QCA50_004976 [Cerrena zonata]|uniref:DUF6534 domain-containing protein n=1 Tax=Cerrena zonata TaxID=2478898 RepID=A0AAW0GIE5_9APHY